MVKIKRKHTFIKANMKYYQTCEEMPIFLTNQKVAYFYQGKHVILSNVWKNDYFFNQSKGSIPLSRQTWNIVKRVINAYFLTNQKEAYLYQGKHEILSDMCEEMPIFLNQSKGRITLSRQAWNIVKRMKKCLLL